MPGTARRLRPSEFEPAGTPADEILRPAPAFFPDPLFESFPYTLPTGRTDSMWITVYAPAPTKPGLYKGEVVVEAAGQRLGAGEFQIRVVEAAVPERQTLRVTNWLATSPAHFAAQYKISGEDDRYWELLGNIGRVMAAHKQNVILTPVMELADTRVQDGKVA